ncbi:unnamed protein product [Sphagnum jensenii]
MSAGDGAHQPQLAAEGLAEILLGLERVERDEDLTYEATLLFGGMGLHDQQSDLCLDVDNMSYELLDHLCVTTGAACFGGENRQCEHRSDCRGGSPKAEK